VYNLFESFQVLTAASTNMTAFWAMATCSLVEVDRRFSPLALFITLSSPDPHPFPIGPAKILPCQPHSDISTDFLRGLFLILMMDALITSEKSVYFNETTRRYILESCHFQVIFMIQSYLLLCKLYDCVNLFSLTIVLLFTIMMLNADCLMQETLT
jgi:hypothetical protein